MSRLLSMRRARVAPADRASYLATVGELAGRLGARGLHLWLFERRGQSGEFLEFREGPDQASAPGLGPADDREAGLGERLDRLARYDAGHDDLWEEHPLGEPGRN